jgi:hypothetical protein
VVVWFSAKVCILPQLPVSGIVLLPRGGVDLYHEPGPLSSTFALTAPRIETDHGLAALQAGRPFEHRNQGGPNSVSCVELPSMTSPNQAGALQRPLARGKDGAGGCRWVQNGCKRLVGAGGRAAGTEWVPTPSLSRRC